MRSIRVRLIAGLLAAVLLVAAIAGTVLLLLVQRRVTEDFDAALAAKARAMAAMVRQDEDGEIEVNYSEEMLGEYAAQRRPEYFEVRDSTGRVLARSPSLRANDLPPAGPVPQAITLPSGHDGRAVSMTFVPQKADEDQPFLPKKPVTLTLARGTKPIERMLEIVGWGLALAAAVMAAGAAAAVWILVDRELRPLRGLADRAGRIDAANLSDRFDPDVPAELRPIVSRLNELLARLEAAFARERRFTAAAAHELRTPIAELRAMAEVALRWPDERPNQAMPEVLEVARNMESLAASLLALSRCESGQEVARREPVDLAAIVQRASDSVAARAQARGLRLAMQRDATAPVLADPAMTEAIARNLLDNAVEYATAGSEIRCRIQHAAFSVCNAQEGLSGDDLSHLFEPFWRKDKARSGGAHAGLGLSLVKAYATAMWAQAQAGLTATGEFEVDISFSTAPAETACAPNVTDASSSPTRVPATAER